MSGREKKRRKPAAKRAASPRRQAVKPALGNDPFENGAAVREPARLELATSSALEREGARAEGQPVVPPSAIPTAIPEVAPAAEVESEIAFEAVAASETTETETTESRERTITPTVHPAAPPSAAAPRPARDEDTGGHAHDLFHAVARLAPVLREKLAEIVSFTRAVERPGELDPYGLDRDLVARTAPLFEFLYSTWWRVEVRQIEHIPAEGPVIVIANHGGALPWDALVLRLALAREHPARRDLRPLLDDAVMKAPILGFLAARLGAVAATPENALQLLARGGAVGFFPEGTADGARPWTQRYRVRQFGRGGFARVAIRAGAAIVPCAVVGSEETSAPPARCGWLAESLGVPLLAPALRVPLGPLGLLPLPARWSLRFGEPIAAGAQPDDAADESRVFDLTERTRSALQQMLDEDVAARRSVYL